VCDCDLILILLQFEIDTRVLLDVLPNARLVRVGLFEHECSGVAVERVRRVGVEKQLRQEHGENVDQIVHRTPRLIDHVQTHRSRCLVDIRMEDLTQREKQRQKGRHEVSGPEK